MRTKQKILAGRLLEMASEEFSNHGCNDLDETWLKDWSDEEKQAMAQDMVKYNIIDQSDIDDYDGVVDHLLTNDTTLMDYFAKKLMNG